MPVITYNKSIQLTDEQRATIREAIGLLGPLVIEQPSHLTYYFESQDERGETIDASDYAEYDCCGSGECVEKTLAELQEKFPGVRIGHVWTHNNGDHDSIERCYQCGCPLNESLTWIEQELEHHEKHTVTREELSGAALFDVRAILAAMPTCDEQISEYAIDQAVWGNSEPLQREKQQQEAFVARVVAYAQHIIHLLNSPA